MKAFNAPPIPPVNAVPPTIAAVIAGKRKPLLNVGLAQFSLELKKNAAIP